VKVKGLLQDIFGIIAVVCFFLILGIVGSIEIDRLPLGEGLAYISVLGLVSLISGLIGFRW
jgi:hypothetical protein